MKLMSIIPITVGLLLIIYGVFLSDGWSLPAKSRRLTGYPTTPPSITTHVAVEWRKQTLTLPCGNQAKIFPGMTIPTKDVPCPCGNPNHWLWKFRD